FDPREKLRQNTPASSTEVFAPDDPRSCYRIFTFAPAAYPRTITRALPWSCDESLLVPPAVSLKTYSAYQPLPIWRSESESLRRWKGSCKEHLCCSGSQLRRARHE